MKKKTVNTRKRRFTLVELLVSMGVLVVILGFILQFFTGSQRLWQSMEQRNNIYADARIAMDVMTTMLQNSFYSEGGIPFRIFYPKEENNFSKFRHRIYFATQSMQNLPGGRLKYVSFQLGDGENTGEKDELKIAVLCDKESDFDKYFPPYGLEGVENLDEALAGVCNRLDEQLKNTTRDPDAKEPYGSVLIRGVISFQITPYKFDETATNDNYMHRIKYDDSDFVTKKLPKDKNKDEGWYYDNRIIDPPDPNKPYKLPFMVELKLTLLSPADFKIWQSMGGFEKDDGDPDSSSTDQIVEFRKTHAYTFSRTVFIGERARMNINEE